MSTSPVYSSSFRANRSDESDANSISSLITSPGSTVRILTSSDSPESSVSVGGDAPPDHCTVLALVLNDGKLGASFYIANRLEVNCVYVIVAWVCMQDNSPIYKY